MISVHAVTDRVGPGLVRAVLVTGSSTGATDVVIAERHDRAPVGTGDLVLGVAIETVEAAVDLVRHSGRHGAAAVLLKPPNAADPSVLAEARKADIALVEVQPGAGWAQLVWLLRAVLDAASVDDEGTVPPGLGDLFRLADAVAAVVNAPVTIEDPNSRVLAYSERQDGMDQARVSTIMGRRVPGDVLARFRARGVFRELSRGGRPVFVPAQPDGTLPRLIVPIRMGGELLGSMWAVVPGPVSADRATAFADTGPVVALHLLRWRARADAERRRSAEQLTVLLTGGQGLRSAAAELGLTDDRYRVVAIDYAGEDTVGAEGARLTLWEQLTRGVGRRPAVADLDGMLYAVVPDKDGPASWPSLRAALRSQDPDRIDVPDPLVAAGSPVGPADLPDSRAQADETITLLRSGLIPGPVADYTAVWSALVLHRAAVAVNRSGIDGLGPLGVLTRHDEVEGSAYVATLYQWLRHPGDPRTAGRKLGIHPNTFRYRLRRLTELTGIDLDDPDTRLALLTQLIGLRWA